MILATFTQGSGVVNANTAMSMRMPRVAKRQRFVRAQSGDKPSDTNALERNYLRLTLHQHQTLEVAAAAAE